MSRVSLFVIRVSCLDFNTIIPYYMFLGHWETVGIHTQVPVRVYEYGSVLSNYRALQIEKSLRIGTSTVQ